MGCVLYNITRSLMHLQWFVKRKLTSIEVLVLTHIIHWVLSRTNSRGISVTETHHFRLPSILQTCVILDHVEIKSDKLGEGKGVKTDDSKSGKRQYHTGQWVFGETDGENSWKFHITMRSILLLYQMPLTYGLLLAISFRYTRLRQITIFWLHK